MSCRERHMPEVLGALEKVRNTALALLPSMDIVLVVMFFGGGVPTEEDSRSRGYCSTMPV